MEAKVVDEVKETREIEEMLKWERALRRFGRYGL
jgi:hypothetical protein